jgi:hypothetical protein
MRPIHLARNPHLPITPIRDHMRRSGFGHPEKEVHVFWSSGTAEYAKTVAPHSFGS